MTQTSLLNYFSKAPRNIPLPIQPDSRNSLLRQDQQENCDALDESTEISSKYNAEFPYATHTETPRSVVDDVVPLTTKPPHTRIALVEARHLPALKRLTATTLPVRYSDKFFNISVEDQIAYSLSRVALYDSDPVGWIRCRLEPEPPATLQGSNIAINQHQIYIQTLCLLAPYRRCGLATQLLEEVLHSDVIHEYNVRSIYAHVHEENEDALLWYENRGFRKVLLISEYYRKLRPAGAWIVRKEL